MQSTATTKRLPQATQVALAARGAGLREEIIRFSVRRMEGKNGSPVREGSDLFNAAVAAAKGTGLQPLYTAVTVLYNGASVNCRVFAEEGF